MRSGKMKNCPRCGAELTPDNIYIVGFCEPCVHVIIDEWLLRQDEPLDYTVAWFGRTKPFVLEGLIASGDDTVAGSSWDGIKQ